MKLLYINNDTQVNVDNLNALKLIKRKDSTPSLSIMIGSDKFIVANDKVKEFLTALDNYERSVSYTRQYNSL